MVCGVVTKHWLYQPLFLPCCLIVQTTDVVSPSLPPSLPHDIYLSLLHPLFSSLTPYISSASWYMGSNAGDARKDYQRRRINRSVFADIDELSDKNSSLPHMLPAEEQFSEQIGNVCAYTINIQVSVDLLSFCFPPFPLLLSPAWYKQWQSCSGVWDQHKIWDVLLCQTMVDV